MTAAATIDNAAGAMFAEYARRGLKLCPIPPGLGGPRTDGWQLLRNAISSPAIAAALKGAGLLHEHSGTCAIDFDDLAWSRTWLAGHGIDVDALLGAADAVGIVSGRLNRAKLLYRLPKGCAPLPTHQKRNEASDTALEFRCKGVQDVLPPTIHRVTGKPYTWAGDWINLPELPTALHDLWRSLAVVADAERAPVAPSGSSLGTLRTLVSAIPAATLDGYDDWLRIGMALHHETDGSDEGLDLWDEASRPSPKYVGHADLAHRWAGFGRRDGAVAALTTLERLADPASSAWQEYAGSDFDIVSVAFTPEEEVEQGRIREQNARRPAPVRLESDTERAARRERETAARQGNDGEHRAPTQRKLTGSEMLSELVFIEEGSRVAFIGAPRLALPFAEFKAAHAGSKGTAKNAAGRTTVRHLADLWLEAPERKTVRTMTFAPGAPPTTKDPDGQIALNTWRDYTEAAPGDWPEISAPLFEHIAYLVPNEAERKRFTQWLAHAVQCPGELPSTHYLMVAKQTGIGRNTLGYMLARVLAGYTAVGFDLPGAMRSGFNGKLSQRLLVIVDELHEGGAGAERRSHGRGVEVDAHGEDPQREPEVREAVH